MSLIKKSDEILVQDTVKCLIYGQPATGKSTLALSAPAPLYLDFDTSASRLNAAHRVDTLQVGSWTDVQEVFKEDLSAYKSIVVDTVGKMIDYIITHVCGTRNPQIKDWGTINQQFQWFCRTVYSLNKHVIFVAHRDTRREGDNTIFVPAIREKNYNTIVTELDLMGYIESRGDKRIITFDFSDRNDGKNTCNLPRFIEIPTIVDAKGTPTCANNFFETGILQGFKSRLEQQAQLTRDFKALCAEIDESIELVNDANTANLFCDSMKKMKHVASSKVYAGAAIKLKVRELNLTYNKDTKKYEDGEQAAEA